MLFNYSEIFNAFPCRECASEFRNRYSRAQNWNWKIRRKWKIKNWRFFFIPQRQSSDRHFLHVQINLSCTAQHKGRYHSIVIPVRYLGDNLFRIHRSRLDFFYFTQKSESQLSHSLWSAMTRSVQNSPTSTLFFFSHQQHKPSFIINMQSGEIFRRRICWIFNQKQLLYPPSKGEKRGIFSSFRETPLQQENTQENWNSPQAQTSLKIVVTRRNVNGDGLRWAAFHFRFAMVPLPSP